MNAGFSNLDYLKKQILSGSMSASSTYDARILAIGLGAAAAIEKFCNRKFFRTVDDTFICTADRDHAYVPRYPLEAVSKIELKADSSVGWEVQTDLILNWNAPSGLVYWGAGIAYAWAQMQITFTGGFFWETKEPTDGGYPTAAPAGATLLPDDLKLAWILQCKEIWSSYDVQGIAVTGEKPAADVKVALADLKLSPLVEQMITAHRRYSML